MSVRTIFLRDIEHGGQFSQPDQVIRQLVEFVQAAQRSLHFAIYDFRLDPHGKCYSPLINALREGAQAGVDIKIAYDHGKPQGFRAGADPAPTGTQLFLQQAFQGTSIQIRGITDRNPLHLEPKLMHSKYIIRDETLVWTGSVNLTDDSWTFEENNIVQVNSPNLASYYETDFSELWTSGDIDSTGQKDAGTIMVDQQKTVDVAFSPGEGSAIDTYVANLITYAKRRIKLASMLISSHQVLHALLSALHNDQVPELSGIYDSTQMEETIQNWRNVPQNAMYIPMFLEMAEHFSHKASIPYSPDSKHNFMHNKIVVCDNSVFTGSFNLSHSATQNAENVLIIHDAEVADRYAAYIDQLVTAYSTQQGAYNPAR
jgi:phosphatidylserine/phosphatidylglycerophosphate/cardiolipin synthase-like enzyme